MFQDLQTGHHVAPHALKGVLELAVARLGSGIGLKLPRLKGLVAGGRVDAINPAIAGLIRGNGELAAEFYQGRYVLLGSVVEAGPKGIFETPLPSLAAYRELHGFGWLQHLKAAGRELDRAHGRALFQDWLDRQCYRLRVAREVEVRARRLISLVQNGGFLITGAPASFATGFYGSLGRQARSLYAAPQTGLRPPERLQAAIALAYAAVGLSGLEGMAAPALQRLGHELDAQILPDGGHLSRSPAQLLDLLVDLLPLRMTLEERRHPVPQAIHGAIERMLPMLRFFLHGDQGIATFNGSTDPAMAKVKAVLETDDTCGRPLAHAPHSGYARLEQGAAVVLVDVGRPPAPGLNSHAASAPLAFEFSDGPHRVIVNCGAPAFAGTGWDAACRMTAAASTAEIGGVSSGRIITGRLIEALFGTPILIGPRIAQAEVKPTSEGWFLEARHDGYVGAFGVRHERRLFLAPDGGDLRGEDWFVAERQSAHLDQLPYALRFHLHPAVKAIASKDGASVMLQLPNKAGWTFTVRGGVLRLEDSVYLPGRVQPRRSQQIVVRGVVGRPGRINWAFKRIAKRKANGEGRAAGTGQSALLL
jgi:uncharacterized heparinase superfamily protein